MTDCIVFAVIVFFILCQIGAVIHDEDKRNH